MFLFQTDKWKKLPSRLSQDGSIQPFWLDEITETSIHLEVKHFCNFALSAGEPADMTILMYMQPSIIMDDTNAVYVSVYAVQESRAEVSWTTACWGGGGRGGCQGVLT